MNIPIRRTQLSRLTPFGFSCSRCLRCCRDKKIQVNPYEIARLAENRGMSTTDFIRRFTTNGGTLLKWDNKGICVFLDSEGCGVHPDRPLVCRLYPLGRHVRNSGEESFSEIEPDPECRGVYANEGMIMDYLKSQGATPFMTAADIYLGLFWRLHGILLKESVPSQESAIVDVFEKASVCERDEGKNLTDMDATVTAYCEKNKIPFPKDAEEKMSVHIRALEDWANNI